MTSNLWNKFKKVKIILYFLCRSICEDPSDAKRQEAEEEEDDNQEEHPQPLLQRVF